MSCVKASLVCSVPHTLPHPKAHTRFCPPSALLRSSLKLQMVALVWTLVLLPLYLVFMLTPYVAEVSGGGLMLGHSIGRLLACDIVFVCHAMFSILTATAVDGEKWPCLSLWKNSHCCRRQRSIWRVCFTLLWKAFEGLLPLIRLQLGWVQVHDFDFNIHEVYRHGMSPHMQPPCMQPWPLLVLSRVGMLVLRKCR